MNSLLSSCTSHQSFTGITMDYPSLLKLCPKLRHFPSWTTRGASHSPSWPQEGWLWDPGEAMSSRTWHWRLIDFDSSIIRPIMTYHFFLQNLGCCLFFWQWLLFEVARCTLTGSMIIILLDARCIYCLVRFFKKPEALRMTWWWMWMGKRWIMVNLSGRLTTSDWFQLGPKPGHEMGTDDINR